MDKYVSVKGSKIHYVEMGLSDADPILFLHGIPTSSYVWRHVMPTLSKKARCIAPDLIGMGQSDKPNIAYRVFDHIAYIEAFIDALQLKNITLVLHGWGSVIGLDYARRHEHNIKAIACYESHLQPITDWSQLSLPVQQLATLLNRSEASYRAVMQRNYFIEKVLPNSLLSELSDEAMQTYRAPFTTEDSRKPIWQYLQDLPLGKGPADVVALIKQYADWLQRTEIPKLILYAMPGFATTIETVAWAKKSFPNTQVETLGNALHLAQESSPAIFSEILGNWYCSLSRVEALA